MLCEISRSESTFFGAFCGFVFRPSGLKLGLVFGRFRSLAFLGFRGRIRLSGWRHLRVVEKGLYLGAWRRWNRGLTSAAGAVSHVKW